MSWISQKQFEWRLSLLRCRPLFRDFIFPFRFVDVCTMYTSTYGPNLNTFGRWIASTAAVPMEISTIGISNIQRFLSLKRQPFFKVNGRSGRHYASPFNECVIINIDASVFCNRENSSTFHRSLSPCQKLNVCLNQNCRLLLMTFVLDGIDDCLFCLPWAILK